jgi:hypothetical protein
VNLLLLISVIAVNHRVGQSFIYGDFNRILGLFRRATFFHEKSDESDELINEWRDVSRTACQGLT